MLMYKIRSCIQTLVARMTFNLSLKISSLRVLIVVLASLFHSGMIYGKRIFGVCKTVLLNKIVNID